MKNKLLIFIGMVSLALLSLPNAIANASENTLIDDPTEEVVAYEELSEEAQLYFLEQGFNETNEYFQHNTIQQSTSEGNINQRAIGNIITITGSTKKLSNSMAHTTYIITSGSPILKASTQVTLVGYKTFESAVIPYGSPTVVTGGIYSSYTGSQKYFTVRLASQVTTSLGTVPVGSGAGGVTLGN